MGEAKKTSRVFKLTENYATTEMYDKFRTYI